MRLQADAGHPDAVRRTLSLLETRLTELGITPGTQTRQVAASLLGAASAPPRRLPDIPAPGPQPHERRAACSPAPPRARPQGWRPRPKPRYHLPRRAPPRWHPASPAAHSRPARHAGGQRSPAGEAPVPGSGIITRRVQQSV
jgi:hypothetical protein